MPEYIIRALRDGNTVREDVFESTGMEVALEHAKHVWHDIGPVSWLALHGEDYPQVVARITAVVAPRKGQRITYKGREVGTVDHLDGNLCWVRYDDGTTNPFIWRFRDGLNALHDWPGKAGRISFCPGV